LVGESDKFVAGWVTIYPTTEEEDINLLGTLVCPRYVHFIPAVIDLNQDAIKLHVYPYAPVDLKDLNFGESSTVTVDIDNSIVTYSSQLTILGNVSMDGIHVYSINGKYPDANGNITIDLTTSANRWVLNSDGVCLKVGLNTATYSCEGSNYIEEALNPNTYTDSDWPLHVAFTVDPDTGRYVLDMTGVYEQTFNTYENGGVGLKWNQLSHMHDGVSL
jgi:hypothetical protein